MIDEMCINSVLLSGAKEVFETMIFMNLEECTDPEQQMEGDVLMGSITFKGDISGCLAIYCNFACAKVIGANMLGMDPNEEIGRDDVYDAIGEVTNMVMGSVKSQIQDSMGDLQVSIPMIISGQDIQTSLGEESTHKAFIKVSIDDEYVAEFSLMYREGSD